MAEPRERGRTPIPWRARRPDILVGPSTVSPTAAPACPTVKMAAPAPGGGDGGGGEGGGGAIRGSDSAVAVDASRGLELEEEFWMICRMGAERKRWGGFRSGGDGEDYGEG